MVRRHRLRVALVALALVLAGGACSGDDGDVAEGGGTSATRGGSTISPNSTLPAVPAGAECESIQVLLKLEVTPEEIAGVAGRIDEMDGVRSSHLVDPDDDAEPTLFLVAVETPEVGTEVGEALAGDPAVVSVVFPDQVC